MKWIRYTIFLFVGICWFCGCQKDDLSGFEDSEKLAITLSGGIEQEMVSRVNDEGFCDEDVMGVYIVDYEGENPGELQLDGIRASNVRFTYDEAANRWNGAYDIYWKDKKICGTLIENDLTGIHISRSISGTGVNLNQERFISDAPNPVSLFQITGQRYDRKEILHQLMERVAHYYTLLKNGETDAPEYLKKILKDTKVDGTVSIPR